MKFFRQIPKYCVSFLKPQKDLLLKDPLRDVKIVVEQMQQNAKRNQIYRTETGFVPKSLIEKWQSNTSKELTILEKKIDLPYNFEGIDSVPEEKTSFLGENIFMETRVRKNKLLDHLIKIYKGVLYSMAAQDEEFLAEYTERRFSERLLESLKQLKEKGDEVIVFEDVLGDRGEPIPDKCFQVEIALIRGLNVDREKNLSFQDYHQWRDIDDMGIISFTPNVVQNPENFIDPKANQKMYEDYKQMVMRILVRIQTSLRIKILKQNGQLIVADSDNYSYNHLAIFESQMIPPEKFNSFYKLENYQQWLNKFNLGTWKLVDIDNWMNGNPMILQQNDRSSYSDKVFAGSDFDPQCMIDIRRV